MTSKPKVLIRTLGCQMNVYESQVAEGLFRRVGFEVVGEEERADVIVFNTCSVRQHAEDRVFGQLAELKRWKTEDPRRAIGLMGCMSDHYKEKLLEWYPHLDFVVGTRNVAEVAEVARQVMETGERAARIRRDGWWDEYLDVTHEQVGVKAYLPIMTGCDHRCTYCIVPTTRGTEVSMPKEAIVREIQKLVDRGAREVELLGQNVNSYGKRLSEPARFPELLAEIAERVEGLQILSFMTSHPMDAREDLFRAIADHPVVSRRFHLPVQSGSDRMLKRMGREYRVEEYRRTVEAMRRLVPDVAITTDIICGFSDESEGDHAATRSLMTEIQFDDAFIFQYSVREGTPAERLADDVPQQIKVKRVNELLDLQRSISRAKRRARVGEVVSVLVMDRSKKSGEELLARTWRHEKVVFPGPRGWIGQVRRVRLKGLNHETFLAEEAAAS